MSFSASSSGIAILPNSTLTAQCKRCNGDSTISSINLDHFIGNSDGIFQVGGSYYSRTARGIAIEYSDCSTVLLATLQKRDQSWQEASINLDRFIANQDGELRFVLDSFHQSLEELIEDSAMFWPLSNQSHCEAVETAVSQCRTTGDDLRENINSCIASEIDRASASLNVTFKAIKQAQETMNGCLGDTVAAIDCQALQLSTNFDDASRDWMGLADVVGRSSQRLKDFQHTNLHDAFQGIAWTEQRIQFDIRRNNARSKSITMAIKSLEQQIEHNEGAQQTAEQQRNSANDRIIGFSVASLFLPFVFIPFAITAAQERGHWHDEKNRLREKIRNAYQEQEQHASSLKTLALSLETAEKNRVKCKELYDTTELLQKDCCSLETQIHEFKNHVTACQQHLAHVESNAVGALRWNEDIEEIQGLLKQSLGMRSEMITLRDKCLLLGSVKDMEVAVG